VTVAHAVLSLDVGGLERVVLDLARAGGGAVVAVDRPGQLADAARAAGVEVIDLGGDAVGRNAVDAGEALAGLRQRGPVVVHTHQIGAASVVAPVARRLGLSVVHTEHGNAFARAAGPLARMKLRAVYRRVARAIDRFCCVTPEIAAAVARYGTVRRPLVVPNGVALPAAGGGGAAVRADYAIRPGAFLVGSVGRLNEVKRFDILLRAVAEVRASRPEVALLLVGDGPERPALERLAAALGLGEVVRFAGYQPQPEAFHAAFDAFALTSRSEGFPVSLLEAWAAGKPAVATAVGGLPDIVRDGADGLLVPFGPTAATVSAVAAALRRLYDNTALRSQLGAAGRARVVAEYTLDRLTERYAAVYADAARNRGE
jgi:glycosyltransferase involved in cell wall biosynthesis